MDSLFSSDWECEQLINLSVKNFFYRLNQIELNYSQLIERCSNFYFKLHGVYIYIMN